MGLDQIARATGYRIFSDFSWPPALKPFARYNLIYGWNGSGKTTFTSLLKALQARANLPAGQVEYVLDGQRVRGDELSQSRLPAVRVFDRDTVSRSVFESGSRSPDDLPHVFVFGEYSAEKQRRIDEIQAQLPALETQVAEAAAVYDRCDKQIADYASDRARSIKNLLISPGGQYNNFHAGEFRTQIASADAKRDTLEPEERQRLVDLKDAKPMPFVLLPAIVFPDVKQLQETARAALARTVVSSVIKELADNPEAASWVQSGLALHTHGGTEGICLFCTQPLPQDRLGRLEAHFNDQFREFTQSLDRLSQRIEELALALEKLEFPAVEQFYPELQNQYARHRSALEASLLNVRTGLSALAAAVREKKTRMFESLALEDLLAGGRGNQDESKSLLLALLAALNAGLPSLGELMGKSAFDRLQQLVEKHNSKTHSFSDQVKQARDQLLKHELAAALTGWQEREEALTEATRSETFASQALAGARETIRDLSADILLHRQPADDLNRDLAAYLGHAEIRFSVEKTGYRLMRHGTFASHLSEGERTAIAFLYFLKSLDDRSFDLKSGIVVVDDPISSLDSNAVYAAFGFMKRKLHDVGQLFVLTHNFTFFRQVKNWLGHVRPTSLARFYQLKAVAKDGRRTSGIHELDAFLKDYESEYHYLFKCVVDAGGLAAGGSIHRYYELPNLCRRLLEAFLIFKVPDENSLFQRLEAIDFDGPRKTRLLRFVDTHSHAEQIAEGHDDASALAEAPEIVRDLLELIEHCDPQHYARMNRKLGYVGGE